MRLGQSSATLATVLGAGTEKFVRDVGTGQGMRVEAAISVTVCSLIWVTDRVTVCVLICEAVCKTVCRMVCAIVCSALSLAVSLAVFAMAAVGNGQRELRAKSATITCKVFSRRKVL